MNLTKRQQEILRVALSYAFSNVDDLNDAMRKACPPIAEFTEDEIANLSRTLGCDLDDARPDEAANLTHWLVVAPHYWGRGETKEAAWRAAREQGLKGKPNRYKVYRVTSDAFVDSFGNLSYPLRNDGLPAFLEVESVGDDE